MSKRKRKTKRDSSQVTANIKQYLLPPMVGVIVMLLVFGVFNSQYISAKIVNAGSINSNEETADINNDLQSSQANDDIQNTIKIAALNINAPINEAPDNSNEATFQSLLQSGVVHYPKTADPGNKGNVVIFGHSSGRWWAPGEYKFVFSKLEKLANQDKIFVDFAGKRFMYEVINQQIVSPYEVSVLDQTSDYRLTLITCYPVGSNAQRLIVTAKQVLPTPEPDQEKPEEAKDNQQPQALPAQTPTFWDNLRSLF